MKMVIIQICYCHFCKIVFKDVELLKKNDRVKYFLKSQIATAANISNIEYFYVWVQNMLILLLSKIWSTNVERLYYTL